jgi:hypothetical protein
MCQLADLTTSHERGPSLDPHEPRPPMIMTPPSSCGCPTQAVCNPGAYGNVQAVRVFLIAASVVAVMALMVCGAALHIVIEKKQVG